MQGTELVSFNCMQTTFQCAIDHALEEEVGGHALEEAGRHAREDAGGYEQDRMIPGALSEMFVTRSFSNIGDQD